MLSRKLTAVLCLVAGVACAAPVYTVTLPNGATNTLSEAFANGYVTSSEGAATAAGLNAAEDLRVTGGGRLEINEDLKSAGFAGEVHVLPGAVLRLTANGALGDTAHGTFVADGATLETECLDTSAQSKLDFAGEKLSFAGTGVDGCGALVARTPKNQERNGVWGGTILTMTGDATIATVAGYQDFPNNSANNSLDMNGHTLTVAGIPNAAGNVPGGVCLRPVVTNPGHIVVTNCGVSINDNANLGGGAANTLTLASGANLELFSYRTPGRKKWTLRIPSSNRTSIPIRTSQTGGVWDGPIVYEREAVLKTNPYQNGSAIHTNSSSFCGKITAPYGLSIGTEYPNLPRATVTLASPENDIGKSCSVSNVNLYLAADGALSTSCGTCRVDSAAIEFDPLVESYSLPMLEVQNTASVEHAMGAWQGIVKRGTGTLTYVEGLTFPSLDLEAGCFSMRQSEDEVPRAFYAGLHYGYSTNYVDWYKADEPNIANKVFYNRTDPTVTNRVVLDVSDLNVVRTQPTGAGTWYQGYVWNSANEPVTWRFAICCTMRGFLRINGQMVIEQAANQVSFGNAVLRPGANALDFRLGSGKLNKSSYTVVNPSNNSLWTHGYGFAYCTTSTTSTNSADFSELSDPGDGSVLRLYIEGSDEWKEKALVVSNECQVVEKVTAAAATSVDIGSSNWKVGELDGCPIVLANSSPYRRPASFSVVKRWRVDGVSIAEGAWTCKPRLVFSEGSVIEVAHAKSALAKAGKIAAAVSEVGIDGLPLAIGDDGSSFHVTKSDDGKTLFLRYIPNGTLVIFR